jgi:hypothetical protein
MLISEPKNITNTISGAIDGAVPNFYSAIKITSSNNQDNNKIRNNTNGKVIPGSIMIKTFNESNSLRG